MILLVDIGNSRIKWRLSDDGQRIEGAAAHDDLDPLRQLLTNQPRIDRIVAANVAGPCLRDTLEQLATNHRLRVEWLLASPVRCGVRNLYHDAAQLGADRWAAAIGARHHHPHPCIVVMAGTATTVDLIDGEGCFHGGIILPGVELMQRALASNTAQLTLRAGRFDATPKCTADAIFSGCVQAQAGAVERMFAQISGQPGARCLISGGAADAFCSLLSIPKRKIDNLVLDGLACIAAEA
ncbi:type III pantothenate kinase [Azoarcus communis]|uniref:Type III pantothenate kinase n=1 Tax=Parazoarcus communis SWub3 = DSM 12120 TaxID=1121029 RepID=A0A323UVK9_9RHOO|nr:type III pantothenate kinase [Parazoarcus communis]NMG50291.1 type III pantothenate kinase [Parazoarcus communis]NMG71327.1 type III pantothenate kinase [Parazoarcus communis SWub3 = DSM 12120]PZA15690.1 type III pantothenate kinase [Azoarcus communis] [Parazoarcus communis SWub3 = DSM 12120]